MQAKAHGSRMVLVALAGLAVFATFLAATGLERGLVFWYTVIAGAVVVAVSAIWSRGARFALAGLLAGGVLGGGLAAALLWNEARGSAWEDLVRAIAITSGVMLGAPAGALSGWLWSLRSGRR